MAYRFARLLFAGLFFALPLAGYPQLTAPGRSWAGVTQYVNSPFHQDSIFVFFSNAGSLRVSHSTGNNASFKWYRYNPLAPSISERFVLFSTPSDGSFSQLDNLAEGGYRVEVTDGDDSTETFTAWLFTDNVTLTGIDVFNQCSFLQLTAISNPDQYAVEYDRFVYYDLSRPSHTVNNKFGKDYFKVISWNASEPRVEVPDIQQLKLTLENPAPLWDAAYTVTITNCFGRQLPVTSTDVVTAIAAKSDLKIQVDADGVWTDWSSNERYEALLGLRLESLSVNADSLYWQVVNKKIGRFANEYFVIWRDSSTVDQRKEAFPDKDLMVPGYYLVKHFVINTNSGCRDSMVVSIEVDSSQIKADALPNVFSPNDDGVNDMFCFINPEENIKSIRTFTIRILSRTGKQIYSYSGDPREWKGWDGRIEGSGAKAATGVYYFIIEARGWDDRTFKRGPYKGFLHLYADR